MVTLYTLNKGMNKRILSLIYLKKQGKKKRTKGEMYMKQVMMNEMTWEEYNKAKDIMVILPIGATEQHGPHLPLSVDSVIATEFSRLLAKRVGGAVAPTLSYGYKSKPLSGGGPLFPGTIDLRGVTLIRLVEDILEEFIANGAKNIFVNNAHFENEAFVLESIDEVSRKHPEVTILESNWWDVLPQSVVDQVFDEVPFPGWAFEHAAITETSLMLYFQPETVNLEKISLEKGAEPKAYHKYPVVEGMVPASGVLATAQSSTAEKGKLMAEAVLDVFEEIVKEEFKL